MGPEQKLPRNHRIDFIIRDGYNRTIRLTQIPLTPAFAHRPPPTVLCPLSSALCPPPSNLEIIQGTADALAALIEHGRVNHSRLQILMSQQSLDSAELYLLGH
jgi:hypothetical protein